MAGIIAAAVGEFFTWLASLAITTTPEQLKWAMFAVGFSTFVGSFVSYAVGRRDEKRFVVR